MIKKMAYVLSMVVLLTLMSCQTGNSQSIARIDNEKLEELTKTLEVQLVDVRTPEEVSYGLIGGAKHIDFYDKAFVNKVEQLDKSKPVILYCAAGGRSFSAAKKLAELGFEQVYDLKGGYRGWVAEGKPVVKGK